MATNVAHEEDVLPATITNNAGKAEYLRKLSQCAYNIKTIISIHSTEILAYDKELEHLYILEKVRLPGLLNNPIGVSVFPFDRVVLMDNLLAGDCDNPDEIGKIQFAKKHLTILLSKIEVERRNIFTAYKAKTGLEAGEIRDYIINLIESGRKKYAKILLGNTDNLITKDGDEYKYAGKLIIFNQKNILYYHIFDIIFSRQDQSYSTSYADIARQYQERDSRHRKPNPKSIQNTFTNTIWETVLLLDGKKMVNKNGKGGKIVDFKRGSIIINNIR